MYIGRDTADPERALKRALAAMPGAERSMASERAEQEAMSNATVPVRRLMAAMLSDAIHVLQFPLRANLSFAEQRRVLDWLVADDRTFVFAFESVCDVLGLEPAQVRAQVAPHMERVRQRVAAKAAKRARRMGRSVGGPAQPDGLSGRPRPHLVVDRD